MNTERLAVLLLGIMLSSCSKSEDNAGTPPVDSGVATEYTIFLEQDGEISSTGINADALSLSQGSNQITGLPGGSPEITYRDGNSFSFLRVLPDCNPEIRHLSSSGPLREPHEPFGDPPDCESRFISLAHSGEYVFIGYSSPGAGTGEILYNIRILALNNSNAPLPMIALENEPLQLIWSNDRLFVLDYDIVSGKYTLTPYNIQNGASEAGLDLGTGVVKVLKNPTGQLLVSYEGRHLVVDAASLQIISRVLYSDGKDPRYGLSPATYFDPSGVLYYAMPTEFINTSFAHIAGVYDFSKHTAYLYYFENYLSAESIALYGIGDTRSVAFDHHNGLLLIGYEKAGTSGKGGLLRIKPVPDPEFIDQTDLDGVPLHLIVQ